MVEETHLYKQIRSKENIFRAIYSLDSYVFESELLSKEDLELFYKLRDKFNSMEINDVISKVRDRLEKILLNDEIFKVSVYLKPKSYDKKKDRYEARPMHTTGLIDQITMVALLNPLLFEIDDNGLSLGEMCTTLPANFYGNIPSADPHSLFIPWKRKYREYTKEIAEHNTLYENNKKYENEVTLDLVQYFPSLNPLLVYNHILEKHGKRYSSKEKDCFKLVLFKLLCLQVENLESVEEHYYRDFRPPTEEKFVRGIPQGLPQAYLFGNIGMIQVAEIFEKELKGESFYYVDDSTIFTEITEEEFPAVVKKINKELKSWSTEFQLHSDYMPDSDWTDRFIEHCKKGNFILSVHDPAVNDKTSIQKVGGVLANLAFLGKEASLGAFEVAVSLSEQEDATVLNRIRVLRESIEKELCRLDKKKVEPSRAEKNYRTRLVRLKKFFMFREKIMENRKVDQEEIDSALKLLDMFDKNGKIKVIEEERDKFFEEYTDGVLQTELSYYFNSNYDNAKLIEAERLASEMEKNLYELQSHGYLSKTLQSTKEKHYLYQRPEYPYQSLNKYVNKHIGNVDRLSGAGRKGKLVALLQEIKEEKEESHYVKLRENHLSYVTAGSEEPQRKIINALVSRTLNVPVSDEIVVIRNDKRPLTVNEFRLLTYIRNRNCKIADFLVLCDEVLAESFSPNVDLAISEVVPHFKAMVGDPQRIDHLIKVHEYTKALWQNGSKVLHFYTLHDEEHAIELIKASVKVTKSIRHFQLSKMDYYILFIACYLHDISMAVYPDLEQIFIGRSNLATNDLVTKFLEGVEERIYSYSNSGNSDHPKRLMMDVYQGLDKFFENEVRDAHHEDSAEFIRNMQELDFFDEFLRDLVAEISVAHGYCPIEIYGSKSKSEAENINKKYIKAILRLADLFDMAENRISLPILYNSNMPSVSRYHWLSHLLIRDYELTTDYENTQDSDEESYLMPGKIRETVRLVLHLNNWQGTIGKSQKCINKILEKTEDGYQLRISKESNVECKEKCLFMCKWLSHKQYYLFQELYTLQEYIDRCENFFTTEFLIELRPCSTATSLGRAEYSLIDKQIHS